MARNVLSYKFQTAARDTLRKGCADGQRLTREDLSAALAEQGYTVSPELVGAVIESGELNTATQAWDLFRGRYGGIREVDLEAYQAQLAEQAKIKARVAKAVATRKANKAKAQTPEVEVAPEAETVAS